MRRPVTMSRVHYCLTGNTRLGLYGLDLPRISADDENSAVIARRVCRRQEEADVLRVVSLRCADDFFSIAKRNLQASTGATHIFGRGFPALGIAGEVLYEENCFDLFQDNLDPSLLA